MNVSFSDFFKVPAKTVDKYGAFNISLLADLPLFVDPFLLFNSKKPAYRKLHDEMVRYLRFLRDKSTGPGNLGKPGKPGAGNLETWGQPACFPSGWLRLLAQRSGRVFVPHGGVGQHFYKDSAYYGTGLKALLFAGHGVVPIGERDAAGRFVQPAVDGRDQLLEIGPIRS